LNNILWIILGLAAWIGTYLQLYYMKSDIFADVVTLILSVLPLLIAFVSFNVAAARLSGKQHNVALVFLILGVVSSGYFLLLYLSNSKVRTVLKDRGIFRGTTRKVALQKRKVALLLTQVLLGAISVLVSVTLLIWGGWELIQGWAPTGLTLAIIGGGMLGLDRWPKGRFKKWRIEGWHINPFLVTYSALMEGSVLPQPDAARAPAVAS
jgi:Ca2+/Na+ antiporter